MVEFERLRVDPWGRAKAGALPPGGPVFPADAPEWVHRPANLRWVASPPAPQGREPPAFMAGDYAWCGRLRGHFGHSFGEEPLHRLWVLLEHPRARPVFAAYGVSALPPYVAAWLALIGAEPPVVVSAPTLFERMVVGEPGKWLGVRPHPEYPALLARLLPLARFRDPAAPRRIAVLRGHLEKGRCIGETWIERQLAAQGYVAFRPEEHPLSAQIAAYANAERIVMSEGSAIHLFDAMPPVDARVAVLKRRRLPLVEKTLASKVAELACFEEVEMLGSLNPGRPKASALSWADPTAFLRFLHEKGFIEDAPRSDFWTEPGALEADVDGWVTKWTPSSGEAQAAAFREEVLAFCAAKLATA